MGDGRGGAGSFAGMGVTESAVSPSQAEALVDLCAEVQRAFSTGRAEAAAIRAGLAVARELTDRLRAGTTPGARPQSSWTAYMVRRPDGGASLVLEDPAAAHALELRLAPSGRFTGASWRGPGHDPGLLAFRVTASGGGFSLGVSDGRREAEADLGRERVLAFTREPGAADDDPFGASLRGLLATGGLTEVIPATPVSPPARKQARSAAEAEGAAGWVLRVTAGARVGTRYPLEDGAVVGRAKTAAIRLDAKSVSRSHAEVRQHGSGWTISDLGSSNGTWVNGARVTSPTALKLSDQVQVGEVVMLVESWAGSEELGDAETVRNLPLQRRPGS